MKKKYDYSEYDKAYYKKHSEQIKNRRNSLPEEQKQLLKDRAKKYRQDHKEYFKDKLATWRKAHPKYNKSWKEAHPDYDKERYTPYKRQEYENKMLHPMYNTWKRAQQRAHKKNIPFSITLDDLFVPEVCPYLEIPLTGKGIEDNSPSLDRIIPELGYVPGNIEIISMLANRMKNSANPDQLLLFATNTIKKFSDPK